MGPALNDFRKSFQASGLPRFKTHFRKRKKLLPIPAGTVAAMFVAFVMEAEGAGPHEIGLLRSD
jgi:hypothetical protein